MTSLYNCKSEIDAEGIERFRITKFDSDMNVQSSYLVEDNGSISKWRCECPAMGRPTCRHREMLPKFIARGAVNTHWFLDFDRGGWVSTQWEGELTADEYAQIVGPLPNDLLNDITFKEIIEEAPTKVRNPIPAPTFRRF